MAPLCTSFKHINMASRALTGETALFVGACFFTLLVAAVAEGSLLVNLGGPGLTDSSNRSWVADPFQQGAPQRAAAGLQGINGTFAADETVYLDAVFVRHPASLALPLPVGRPGRHWLRLHFAAFPTEEFPDPTASFFRVMAGNYSLLQNLSIVAESILANGGNGLYGAVIKEFSLPLDPSPPTLPVTLTPLPGSFASLAALELVPMPEATYNVPNKTVFSASGATASLPASLALATAYRIKFGNGGPGYPQQDALTRTWLEDEVHQLGYGGWPPREYNSRPRGISVPPYYTPSLVAQNQRELGPAINFAANLSYGFAVQPGSSYFVRLHFCENFYSQAYARVMTIYINGLLALESLDVFLSVGFHTATAVDFLVPMPLNGGSQLRIDIGPSPLSIHNNPAINGMEILKVGVNLSGESAPLVLPAPDAPALEGPPRPTAPPPASPSGSPPTGASNGSVSIAAVIGGTAGALVLGAVLAFVFFWFCRPRGHLEDPERAKDAPAGGDGEWSMPPHARPGSYRSMRSRREPQPQPSSGSQVSLLPTAYRAQDSLGDGGSGNCRVFTLRELYESTQGFSDSAVLGEGGFGKVYKGVLPDGTQVAVKRGSVDSAQGLAEYEAEVRVLSRLRHAHLVSLIGFCEEHEETILVYDYMANGTLRSHLYGTSHPPLLWRQRLEVLLGAARGLDYLHNWPKARIIHRDVKSTNILLDENWLAKMADFGLSKFGPSLDQTHVSTAVKGSFGYLDPDYYRRQQLTEKSDVYSFGVVLLEALCARVPINPSLPRAEANLVDWAMKYIQEGRVEEVADPRMGPYSRASVRKFAQLAAKCLQDVGSDRPSMAMVVFDLEHSLQLQDTSIAEIRGQSGVSSQSNPLNQSQVSVQPSMGTDGSGSEAFSQLIDPVGR